MNIMGSILLLLINLGMLDHKILNHLVIVLLYLNNRFHNQDQSVLLDYKIVKLLKEIILNLNILTNL